MSGIENRKDVFKSSRESVQNHYGELVASKKPVVKGKPVPTSSNQFDPAETPRLVTPRGAKTQAVGNQFLSLLGQWKVQPKKVTPVHEFNACLEDIKRCSEKGDIDEWNELLRLLASLAKAAGIDPVKDLRTVVDLAFGGMELLLNHLNKKVIPEREALLEKEEAAREGDRFEEAEQYSAQVKRLDQMAQWLEGQIMEKTELVLV